MQRKDAEALALDLMFQFGIAQKGWNFAWMTTKRLLGQCRYREKLIRLSTSYVDLNTAHLVEQTIRHEIAHALAGYTAGHGPAWVSMAYKLGVNNPKAVCKDDDLVMPKGRYQATCATCNTVYSMHKRGKNMDSKYWGKCRKAHGGDWGTYRLTFIDTHAMNDPVKSLRVPVSALQSPSVQTVSATRETVRETRTDAPTVQWVNAAQLAVAMGVDGKTLRGWLRKNGGRSFQVDGKYQFTAADVRYLVLKWNESH